MTNNDLPTEDGYSIHTSNDSDLAMNFKMLDTGLFMRDSGYRKRDVDFLTG
jgi:hypothetical protein